MKRIVNGVLVVAVIAAAALTAYLATREEPEGRQSVLSEDATYTAGTVPGAPSGLLQTVADDLPTALSYDHAHLDDDLIAATSLMTETFAEEYRTTFRATVMALATRKKAVSEAHVRAVGLVDSQDDTATVLAYVDQVLLSSKALSAGDDPVKVTQTRVLVSMKRVGTTWKVDGIDPL